MKKVLISATLLIGMMASAMVLSSFTTPQKDSVLPGSSFSKELSAGRSSITVYKLTPIKGTNKYTTTSKSAEVDRDEMVLYVVERRDGRTMEFNYNIRKNPAYGQENDYRSSYEYTAADYYFNL